MARVILYLYTNNYDSDDVPDIYKDCKAVHTTEMDIVEPFNARRDSYAESKYSVSSRNDGASPGGQSTTRALESLRVDTLMYKTADMLGMNRLKRVANNRFMIRMTRMIETKDERLAEALGFIFENTSPDDLDLRQKVVQLCMTNFKYIESRKAIKDIILEHEAVVWNMTVSVLKKNEEMVCKEALKKFVVELSSTALTCCSRCRRTTGSYVPATIYLRDDLSPGLKCRNC